MADETPQPPSPAVPQTVPHTPPVAIWSLILAVLSFTCGWLFTAIPAVICGHIARAKIRKSRGALGGRGIATAGLILGYIALVVGIMGIPLLVSMNTATPRALKFSASVCRVTVFPVPVAPAIKPWRFAILGSKKIGSFDCAIRMGSAILRTYDFA